MGPVGLVQQEIEPLGWDWTQSPWRFDRPHKSPVPLTGGPKGHFGHELREETRQREYGEALKQTNSLCWLRVSKGRQTSMENPEKKSIG